jgi:hypothetical protein
VRGEASRADAVQEPDVRTEGHQGPEHHQVGEGRERSDRSASDRHRAHLAGQRRNRQKDHPCRQELHTRRLARRDPRPGSRAENAHRPGERGKHRRRRSQRVEAPSPDTRERQDRHAGEPGQDGEHAAESGRRGRRARGRSATPREQRDEQRLRRDQQGGGTRRNARLGPREDRLTGHEEEEARQRRVAPMLGPRPRPAPQARPPIERGAGHDAPHPDHEHGRDRLDRPRDGEVRRAPDDPYGPERGGDPRSFPDPHRIDLHASLAATARTQRSTSRHAILRIQPPPRMTSTLPIRPLLLIPPTFPSPPPLAIRPTLPLLELRFSLTRSPSKATLVVSAIREDSAGKSTSQLGIGGYV